jgi:2'-5' RNA ligase
MRVFIGIDVPKHLKDTLAKSIDSVETGRIVQKTNYHLTLVYLGETTKQQQATLHQALSTLTQSLSPCQIALTSLNTFTKGTTHIVYADVVKTDALKKLQQAVALTVEAIGFSLDTRPYNPHVTLARKVKKAPPKSAINDTFTAETLTLFHSHRVNGKLTYTPLKTYPLTGTPIL